jgi:hypothetical protein
MRSRAARTSAGETESAGVKDLVIGRQYSGSARASVIQRFAGAVAAPCGGIAGAILLRARS